MFYKQKHVLFYVLDIKHVTVNFVNMKPCYSLFYKILKHAEKVLKVLKQTDQQTNMRIIWEKNCHADMLNN